VEDTKGWDVGQGGLDFGTAGEHGPGGSKMAQGSAGGDSDGGGCGGFIV
jgi:hypothetical protein